jgi:iron(III) transport system substrate-binding protein
VLTFQQEFPGIQIQYAGMDSPEFFQELEREQQAGRPTWDVRIGDLSPEAFAARDRGSLDPVRPLLLHPEVLDDSVWMGGVDGLFDAEGERRWFAGFTVQLRAVAWANRDFVSRDELRTVKDVVDPKWRGRVALHDPRGGLGLTSLALLLDAYGEGFVRQLLGAPELAVTDDSRQLAEWVLLGQYPIGIGYTTDLARRYLQQGIISHVQPLEEGPVGITSGRGTLQVVRGAPHPNAARLFANWLLTRKVQDRLAQSAGVNSRRIDVWPGDPLLVPDPQRIKDLACVNCERYLPLQARALQIARELVS